MFHRMLHTALEAGSDVALVLRGGCDTRLHGRVQELDDTHVSIYFTGESEGWLWAVRLEDVAACALVVPPPGQPYLEGVHSCPKSA
jgi:hypothetical protein